MSNYKNFIQDFPIRCGEILEGYEKQARQSGREVTHMLAIATIALIIPFERLRKPPGGIKHPSKDKENYEKATGKFSEICGRKFLQSILWQNEVGSWKIGEVEETKVSKGAEEWIEPSRPLPDEYKVLDVLKHIRNALAHGNIFTLSTTEKQIGSIIFLSRIMDGRNFSGRYRFLSVSPQNFNEFLSRWIGFIKNELKLPAGVIDDSEWISNHAEPAPPQTEGYDGDSRG